MRNTTFWWKRQRTLVKAGILAGVVVVFFIAKGAAPEELIIEDVVRQDLSRTVSATGTVVSTIDLSLSFQQSNLVKSVDVVVGQSVKKGQILATLSNASEAAAVQSARGTFLAAQARYNKVLEGESSETVRSAEIAVESARRKLYSDGLVAEERSQEQLSTPPTISGSYNGSQPGEYRISFDSITKSDFRFTGLEKGKGDVDDSEEPLGTRGLLIRFPAGDYSSGDEWIVRIPNTGGVNYVSNLNAYDTALAELSIKKAAARSVDVDAARAEMISAEGSLARALADFEKTVIRAPANGTITKVDLKLGELAETFEPVITLQDVTNLYIEANVNESNISNIALNQPVTITYDALGKDKLFSSAVNSVDLGATIVDGIVNYKVKTLVPDVTTIRSGMTANISIQTAFVPQVIVVPERVIYNEKEQTTVDVLIDEKRGKKEKRIVTTGLRGDGGLVEITSGLSEGERVVFTAR